MISQLNKDLLFATFDVQSFEMLEPVLNNIAPSMVEYYLSDLGSYYNEIYLNKKDIQDYIVIGDYHIYMDYSGNIFLETSSSSEDRYETSSLW